MNRRFFGTEGEQTAREYLTQKGIRILEMNYRRPTGEIDIIGKHRGRILFIEVKRRSSLRYGRPSEAVNPQKQTHILHTAALYLQENDLTDAPVRFDVIEILPGEIRHIENAFDATSFT